MPELERTRDLVVFKKPETTVVTVSPQMAMTGWLGGQGVQWFDSGRDELAVTLSDGLGHAFMLWGADEISDRFTALARNQPTYRFGVVAIGGGIISTRTFERTTLQSRLAGAEQQLLYQRNDVLYFSLAGLWTKEDEWSVIGDLRAPNRNAMGVVIQAPSSANSMFLTLQVLL